MDDNRKFNKVNILFEGMSDSEICTETFNATLEDNLRVIESYPEGVAADYLWKIGGTRDSALEISSLPVVVTAMDKDYYAFSQGMFLTIHKGLMKYYNNSIQLVVYDLGLTERQKNLVTYTGIHAVCSTYKN